MVDDHEDYLPGEAPASHKTTHQDGGADEISVAGLAGETAELAIHAALPTVHQDAPQLILDHKGDAAAHHAKYTDTEARAVHTPFSIPPSAFVPRHDTYDWAIYGSYIQNRSTLTGQYFQSPLFFPPGVTITNFTLYGYRDDALASLVLYLARADRVGGWTTMALLTSNWTTPWNSITTAIITNPIIDNSNYSYFLLLLLLPNAFVTDVKFGGAKIAFSG